MHLYQTGAGAGGSFAVTNHGVGDFAFEIILTVTDSSGLTDTKRIVLPMPSVGTPDVVAAYSFNEGSGTSVSDSSGNGNDGSLTGATWTPGVFSSALSFDGVNDAVTVPDRPGINLGNTGTVEAWVRLNALGRWHGVVAKGSANNDTLHNYALEVTDANRARCILGNGVASQFLDSTVALPANQFRHLACTWNGTTLSLYINAVLNASTAQTVIPAGNTAPLTIGRFGGNSDFTAGIIDEIRVYNRALAQAEIQFDMNTPIILATNTPPTIGAIPDQSTPPGGTVGPVSFTIGDAETPAANLTLSGSSSNPTVLPNAGITFGGSGATRTVTLAAAPGQTGSAIVTVTVSDGQASAARTFTLTAAGANTLPTISAIGDQATNEDTPTGAIAFTVGDTETPVASLTLSGSSDNTALVPVANIGFGGSGANRTVTVTPALNQSGIANITITVSDGQLTASSTFRVTVTAVNDAPSISAIANQTTFAGVAVGPLSVTVGDVETPAASLTLAGTSDNTTLVPNANITFGGSGATRSVTVTPAPSLTGQASITVTVSDGTAPIGTTFVLTVQPVNTAPTISAIADQGTNEDTATGAIAFTVGDAETAAGSLTLSGSSNNTTLVPNANIAFGGSGATAPSPSPRR